MATDGPILQSTMGFNPFFSQHFGAWSPQDIYQQRQTYGFGGQIHHAGYLPFPGQVPHYHQQQFQQPHHHFSPSWIDLQFVPRQMHSHPGRPPAYPILVPPQAPLSAPVPDAPRGPPRKPKQSGHAVWIGNLPANTTIHELKDYCSQDATDDIESVFLISKSNCAFANYNSHATCEAAMYRIQNTSFRSRRLVCRLRMQQASATPSSPSVASYDSATSTDDNASSVATPEPNNRSQPLIVGSDSSPTLEKQVETKSNVESSTLGILPRPATPKVLERFFIVKSLTVSDLVASVNNGSWEAQLHNQDTLSRAFDSAMNVYLVFSANKSGEYFGIARMKSAMYTKQHDDPATTPSPTDEGTQSLEPRSILTPANEVAPSGKIYDDSIRGTVFWEADRAATKNDSQNCEDDRPPPRQQYDIEWLSTSRVPFYRTRGLRNPWNGLKEVKIARDGTELEPSVGRHLMRLFRSS